MITIDQCFPIPGTDNRPFTLAAFAAYSNDLPSLQEMTADSPHTINASGDVVSPLEAGIRGGALECVTFILHHPNFGQNLTFGLLDALAYEGNSESIKECILTASTEVLGEPFCVNDQFPLPSAFTPKFITYASSFLLLARFLLYNDVTAKDLQYVGTHADWFRLFHYEESLSIPFLAQCIRAHPTLLKYKKVQLTFLGFCLRSSLGVPNDLREFIHLLPQKIILDHIYLPLLPSLLWSGSGGLLSRWYSAFGDQITPCLDWRKSLPDFTPSPEQVDQFLRLCQIEQSKSFNGLSPLLLDVARYSSDKSFQTLFSPQGRFYSDILPHLYELSQHHQLPPERQTFFKNIKEATL